MSKDEGIAMKTEDPTHLIAEGAALLKRYRSVEALATYEQVLAVQPEHAQAWSGNSVALLRLDRLSETLEAAERALQLDPASADAYACQGHALRCCNDMTRPSLPLRTRSNWTRQRAKPCAGRS
jgi:tetratricopeptide (TPR) repeat protein